MSAPVTFNAAALVAAQRRLETAAPAAPAVPAAPQQAVPAAPAPVYISIKL